MPSTPFHDHDWFDPQIQKLRDATEKAIYGQTGGLGTDENIIRLFRDGFQRPRNSALAFDVLKTDRWGMRGTMVQLADRLGTDHGTISRWYHQGILPSSIESFLLAHPARSTNPENTVHNVFNARHRNGFMFVARYLFEKMPGHSPSDAEPLMEFQTEALYDMLHLEDRSRWEMARANNDLMAAARIMSSVCDPSDRQITPFWLTKKQHSEINHLIDSLCGDPAFAFEYLCSLQRRWEGVFVLTRAAVEGLGWL